MRITNDEIETIRKFYGYIPIRKLATKLGRSISFVNKQSKRLGLKSIYDHEEFLPPAPFGRAIGANCSKSGKSLMVGKRWAITMYSQDNPVTVVVVSEFCLWLSDPMNWIDINPDSVAMPRMRDAVAIGRTRQVLNRWMTVQESAEYLYYSVRKVKYLCHSGELRFTRGSLGRPGCPKILIQLTDLRAMKKGVIKRNVEYVKDKTDYLVNF